MSEEQLQIFDLLWAQERPHFEGRYYRFGEVAVNPRPGDSTPLGDFPGVIFVNTFVNVQMRRKLDAGSRRGTHETGHKCKFAGAVTGSAAPEPCPDCRRRARPAPARGTLP